MNEKLIQHAYDVICALKEEYADGVIKDHSMPLLVNIKSGEHTGFAVILQLASKYEYTDGVLNDWKKRFYADEYSISAKRNQLTVKYSVHFDKYKTSCHGYDALLCNN